MRKLGIIAAVVAALVVGLAVAYRLEYPTYSHRYRLTIEVETPQGLRSASSVIEAQMTKIPVLLSGGGARPSFAGDAPFVDLGGGKNVVALLARGPTAGDVDAPVLLAIQAFAVPPWPIDFCQWKRINEMSGARDLPPSLVPTLVTVGDVNDLKRVQVIRPDEFEAVFGPGYRFKRAWIIKGFLDPQLHKTYVDLKLNIDLAGQGPGGASENGDLVDASALGSGVLADFRDPNAQFVANLGAKPVKIDHAKTTGTVGEMSPYNAGVYHQIQQALNATPDLSGYDANSRLDLKNAESITGTSQDDIIFGANEVLKTTPPPPPPPPPGEAMMMMLGGPSGSGEQRDLDFQGGKIDAGAGNDIILITNGAEQYLYKTIDAGAGDDIIAINGGVAGEVFGGAGDDTIYVNTRGAKVYGGEGADHFFWAPDILIADGGATDRASLFGLTFTGGIETAAFGDDPLWVRQTFFPWIKYGVNTQGDLVIDYQGKDMFVAGYHSKPNEPNPTLGIYTAVIHHGEDDSNRGLGSLKSNLDALVTLLRQWAKSIGALSPQDPLILDLDGDGIELTPTIAGSGKFDFDDDWFKEQTGWVRPDDGFLALDKDGDGKIASVAEMFGSPTQPGFLALAAFDTNSDGVVDANDTDFARLQVWQDLNQDRVTQAGELKTLTQLGIVSLGVNPTAISVHTDAGHDLVARASFTRADSTTGTIYEALFNVNQAQTEYRGDTAIAPWAGALPNLHGYGILADLGVAASNDFALADAIAAKLGAFTTPDLDQLRADAKPVIDAWLNAHPASRELTAVKVHTNGATATRLDYAVYGEDGSGSYWHLASGAPVLDAQGNAIARPQLADILAQATASGDAWQLQQVWSQSAPAASARTETPYLASIGATGTVTILDYAIKEHDGSGDYWRLASGAARQSGWRGRMRKLGIIAAVVSLILYWPAAASNAAARSLPPWSCASCTIFASVAASSFATVLFRAATGLRS